VIVGRDDELARIRGVVDEARGSRPAALLVTGEAGVGKTALLAEALESTDAVWLVGFEAERDLPYAALGQLVTPLLAYAEALSEPQRAALDVVLGRREAADPGRLVLSMGVLSLIAAAAEEGALVIAVDDVQWLDPPSRDVLLFVARRLVAERVALLLTLREGTLGLDVVGGLPRLELTGLSHSEAEAVLPGVHPRVLHDLVDRTGGNPLALIELGAVLDEAQAAGRRPLPHELAHTRPEHAYAARLADLAAPVRQTARLAALAGDAPREVLLTALGRAGLSLDLLAPLERIGLVTVTGRVAWRHPLARNAAAQGTIADLVACHAALAVAWSDVQPGNPARAWHLAESVTGLDRDASEVLAGAAEVAADRGAWSDAADAWERAARLHPDHEPRAGLLAKAGQAAASAGECLRGAALLDEAFGIVASPGPELLLVRAHLAQALGERQDVRTFLGRVLETSSDPRLRMRALAELVNFTPFEDVHAVLAPHAELIDGTVSVPDDPVQVFCHRYIQASLAFVEGRYDAAEVLVGEAHAGLAAHRVLDEDPTLLRLATSLDMEAGVHSRLRPHEKKALDAARLSGDLMVLVPALMFSTQRTLFSGDFDGEAVENWREVEMLARMAGMPFLFIWASHDLVETDAHAGRIEDARARLEEVRAWRARSSTPWLAFGEPWLEAYVLLADGQPAAAVDVLRPTMPGLRPQVKHNLPVFLALVHETEGADSARSELDRLAHLSGTQYYPLAELVVGDDDHAAVSGVEEYARAGGPPWDIGFLRLHLARRLARAGDRGPAKTLLTEALERFTLVGAAPWIERTEAELRGMGAAVRRHTDGVGLTVAEQRVARLVSEGHTNKEVAALLFLSPKTVEFHLSSAYRKLGVSNRTALARRLGDGPRSEPTAAPLA
jgi:DNA-binding CsgD family transcriptional regulator